MNSIGLYNSQIPGEIIAKIIGFLPAKDVGKVVLVCKKWLQDASKYLIWNDKQLRAEFPSSKLIFLSDWKKQCKIEVADMPVIQRRELKKLKKENLICGIIPMGVKIEDLRKELKSRGSWLKFELKGADQSKLLDCESPKTSLVVIEQDSLNVNSSENYKSPSLIDAISLGVMSLFKFGVPQFIHPIPCSEMGKHKFAITFLKETEVYKISEEIG